MKREYKDYEVVHCETLEQWKIVNSHIDYEFRLENQWDVEKEFTCKVLHEREYFHIRFFMEKNSKIYTFDEWLKLNNLNISKLKEDLTYLIKFMKDKEVI